MGDRKSFTLAHSMKGILENTFLNVKNDSKTILANGRVERAVPAVFSADETADVGKDDATRVADEVFEDVEESEFTGYVNQVTISIPDA